jgi:AraC-like DNA-binding protein
MSEARAVVAAIPQLALQVARERGADPDVLARRVGVDLASLEQSARVSRRVELAMWQAASVDDPDVGLAASESPGLTSSLGTLGFLARSSATALEAIQVGARCHALVKSDVHVSVQVLPARVELTSSSLSIPSWSWPRAAVDFSLLPYVTMTRAWTGTALRPLEVRFTCEGPANKREYDRLLGCRVRFGQKSNVLVFARSDLEIPLQSAQPDLAEYLGGLARAELEGLPHQPSDPSSEVRSLVAAAIARGEDVSLPSVARVLGVSIRTLQRRLLGDATDFQHVVDEVRASAAVELLRSGDLGLAAVADRVGYADVGSLRRAFYRWAGKPPSEIRRELRSERAP